jgi:hypothetical protein
VDVRHARNVSRADGIPEAISASIRATGNRVFAASSMHARSAFCMSSLDVVVPQSRTIAEAT